MRRYKTPQMSYFLAISKMYATRIFILGVLCANLCCAQDVSTIKTIRSCLGQENSVLCLKETALDVVNETIYSEKPFSLFGMIDVVKDPGFTRDHNDTDVLPLDSKERSIKLTSLLYEKIMELLQSRSIKFNLAKVFEGRYQKRKKGRGKKDKKGGMLMMGGLAMAGMVAQMFMGKMVMMSGAALMMAKIALLISVIVGIKKMGGGSGGDSGGGHVVYASNDGYGHSGGWHRSISHGDSEGQNLAYRAHTPDSQPTFSY